ncbi:MAG: GNAT family N-acetyltransferase [Phormidium sp. GEM2.Bin31]|nr:GNAT family N-acetyltransferase [Phormidium sp. BM_Day4_Bin.17]TVR14374.1 MAG: GNAT family N-acetyltransferase [Phormidium sp. GEM2.Bin31]UCJ13327.1 MAG: GNAT family N-acetyltransferase [Phormidium sp. PBR-2020]
MVEGQYLDFRIRPWQKGDRIPAGRLIASVLLEYGLGWEPTGADRDVVEVERFYLETGGGFWVVEQGETLVGTAGFYPVSRGDRAVELRKMYLVPSVRGCGLGSFLLQQLEAEIQQRGFQTIWVETATVLKEAVQFYKRHHYLPATGVETARCDRIYSKTLTAH